MNKHSAWIYISRKIALAQSVLLRQIGGYFVSLADEMEQEN